MTIVVNLFAGPGAGKSTTAAHAFALLKQAGVNCELVREWIKEPVWEGRTLPDQLYIFAKQNRSQKILEGKVDVIITDSPLLLSNIYDDSNDITFHRLVKQVFKSYNNMNYFINRVKEFNPAGRLQTLDEAKTLDDDILELLVNYEEFFIEIAGDDNAALTIKEDVLNALRNP